MGRDADSTYNLATEYIHNTATSPRFPSPSPYESLINC